MANPFHSVRYWSGKQYRTAFLRDAGVYVQLCPIAEGVDPCPGYDVREHQLPADFDGREPPMYGSAVSAQTPSRPRTPAQTGRSGPARSSTPAGSTGPRTSWIPPASLSSASGYEFLEQSEQDDDSLFDDPEEPVWPPPMRPADMDEGEWEEEERGNEEDEDNSEDETDEAYVEGAARLRGRQAMVRTDAWGHKVLVLVHETDLHCLGVAYCHCAERRDMPLDAQLLRLGGLFPATDKTPRTAFTLRGLSYHQIDRLECKVSPQAIFRKIRRRTNPLHPATVPVRTPQCWPGSS